MNTTSNHPMVDRAIQDTGIANPVIEYGTNELGEAVTVYDFRVYTLVVNQVSGSVSCEL